MTRSPSHVAPLCLLLLFTVLVATAAHAHQHAHQHHDEHPNSHSSAPLFKLPQSPYVDAALRLYAQAKAFIAKNPLPNLAHLLSDRLTLALRPLHDLPVEQAAITASLLTSSVSLVSVVLLPFSAILTTLLLPFAAGALLSDLAYHLLPHLYAMKPEPAPLALLLSVAVFTLLDAVLRRTTAAASSSFSSNSSSTHIHTHHAHGADLTRSHSTVEDDWPSRAATSPSRSGQDESASAARVAAYINLAADALHNFCDGLSLAAAFSASPAAGIATTIAIILHELPQELADFALLLRAGFGTRRAILANLLCALTALAGTLVALRASAVVHGADAYILPFAAGALLYLTFSTVIPDVVADLVAPSSCKLAGKMVQMPVSFFRFVLRLMVASMSAAAGVAVVAVVESMHEH